MARSNATQMGRRIALLCGIAAASAAMVVSAQGQQVYRYVDKDGRVVYTDRPPPNDSKEVQSKRLTSNYIETNQAPIALTQAAERFPVTLYTFGCGTVCENAEALLNRRGVPFSTVNVEDAKGMEQLQKLTGAQQAPVLQVGDKMVAKGFNEARWTTMLDDAGYPKSPARRTTAPRARAEPDSAPTPAPAAPPPEPAAPVPGGGYPKQ